MTDTDRLNELMKMLEHAPEDAFSLYALGLEYMALTKYDDAVNIFEKLMVQNPNYHALYYQLGKSYEALGDNSKAKKIYEKGIYITTSQSEMHTSEELQIALDELL